MGDQWIQRAVPESHRGRFTAKAKRAGMTVQAYARKVLAKSSRADKTTKAQARFAVRAGKGF